MLEEYNQFIDTPLGVVEVVASNEGITAIRFCNKKGKQNANELTRQGCAQLNAYFANRLTNFTLSLCPQGTPFQHQVWSALQTVGYGQTACYADIARLIQNDKAVRAVGMANGRNPIAIVIPCHRIIGRNGTLTGYAGGLNRKAYLLELEQRTRACR